MHTHRARICIIRHDYFSRCSRVRKEVCALLEEGYKVDVICLRDEGEKPLELWQGVTIYRLPVRHARRGMGHYVFEYLNFFAQALLKVGTLHVRKNYSLIQINTMPDFLVFAAFFPRLRGAKVLLDLHELMPELFRARFTHVPLSGVLTRLIAFTERCAVRFAHRTLVAGAACIPILKQRHQDQEFVVVHNVPDEHLFPAVLNPASSASHQHMPTLISHGTITEGYGLQVLLAATLLILKEIPNLQVYIVGAGEYLDELRKQANRLGLSETVVFTGRVHLEAVASHIAQSTIGVIPLLQDGYMELISPNKLFEYVALGKPVLTSDGPGIRAYFDERHVEFFRPGDPEDLARKAIALLQDPQRRAELACRAREVYEIVRWERTKVVYKKTICDLLDAERC